MLYLCTPQIGKVEQKGSSMSQTWPTLMGNQQRSGYSQDEFKPPLELAWKRQFLNYPEVGSHIHGSAILPPPSKW